MRGTFAVRNGELIAMDCQLEHANMRVKDVDETVRFLTTAMPNFKVRGGHTEGDEKWLHIGTESTYLCLNEDKAETQPQRGPGLNHVGFIVDDAEAIRGRLEKAGYKEGFVPEPHPHRKRIYYTDGNGTEWEFVQYFSDDPSERNDYTV
jgi:catechol 2,3-dioxygenase-like lactoylglutathione lyase family enzyme